MVQAQRGELMRDPFVQRAPDGSFRMVWTSSTGAPATIGYSTSSNLLFWSEHRQLSVAAAIPAARNALAPAMYYEPDKKDWLILWSSTSLVSGKTGDALDNRIYATSTKDFKRFTPARLFFDPGYAVTGATLLPVSGKEGQFYLLFNGEHGTSTPGRISAATGPSIDGPWHDLGSPLAEAGAESPAAIPVPGGYLVYYNHGGTPQHHGASFSADLQHWTDATAKITLPEGMSRGSLLHLETSEYNLLLDYHGIFDSGVRK